MKTRRQSLSTKRLPYVCSVLHRAISQAFLQSKIPFAVVGSDREVKTPDGRTVRGRAYPWGVAEVDNEDHCDFVKLRQMLIRTYMEELKEHTHTVLYENWRSDKLKSLGIVQDANVFKEVK
jgi:septin 7